MGSQPDSPPVSSTAPSRRTLAWLVVASAVVFGPNILAVTLPFEAFPWTAAPMFAVPPTTHQRAIPVFLVEDTKGEFQPLNVGKVAALSERDFARSFLRTAWGTDIVSPFDHHRDSTAEFRRRRVEDYLKSLMERAAEKKHRPTTRAKRIVVAVDLNDGAAVDGAVDGVSRRRQALGSYDVATGAFRFAGEL